jgi:spatacsin
MGIEMVHEEPQLAVLPSNLESLDMLNQRDISFPLPASGGGNDENLALVPVDSESKLVSEELGNLSHSEKKVLPLENPREMMARWKVGNLDLKTVVKDALLSGRLPLAVLQLHLHQSEDFNVDKEPHDTFTEVRDIGRAVAYDLFMKVMYSTFYLVSHIPMKITRLIMQLYRAKQNLLLQHFKDLVRTLNIASNNFCLAL